MFGSGSAGTMAAGLLQRCDAWDRAPWWDLTGHDLLAQDGGHLLEHVLAVLDSPRFADKAVAGPGGRRRRYRIRVSTRAQTGTSCVPPLVGR